MRFEVVIPDEKFAVLEWEEDDLPAVCVVNQALADFQPKVVFGWHLSIILDCVEVAGSGMPTSDEREFLKRIGLEFDAGLKADGNALFLARITWSGTQQLLYRVYDPEVANQFLMGIIDHGDPPRPFDFRMEQDQAWGLADYFLDRFSARPDQNPDDHEPALPTNPTEPRR